MSKSRMYVKGGREARIKYGKISKELGKPVLTTLQEMAEKIQNTAKSLAPTDDGDMRNSITYYISSDGLTAIIGPSANKGIIRNIAKGKTSLMRPSAKVVDWGKMRKSSKDAYWQAVKASWVEFGTKGTSVKAGEAGRGKRKSKTGKKILSDGEHFFGKEVFIPARPAQPFMNPAYEAHKKEVIKKLNLKLQEMIDLVMDKK